MAGGGSKPSKTTTSTQWSPEDEAAKRFMNEQAMGAFTQQQGSLGGFAGARPVGFSADSLAAQGMLRDFATQQAAPAAARMLDASNYGLTGAMDVNNNPALAGAVDGAVRPIWQGLTDAGGALSAIRSGANANGTYGSTRQGIAEGLATGRAAQAAGDVSSRMMSQAYQQGQDTYTRTLSMMPSLIQGAAMPSQYMAALGGIQDENAREQENYAAAARTWDQNKMWKPIENFASIVGPTLKPGTQVTQSGGGPSTAAQITQGLGTGLMAYALLGGRM